MSLLLAVTADLSQEVIPLSIFEIPTTQIELESVCDCASQVDVEID